MTASICAGARLRRSAALLAALLLAGCASLAPPPPPPAASRVAGPTYLDAIELGGRLSLRYQQNGKDEAVHGSFTWDQAPQRTELILLSPLGQTIARLDITPLAASLTQANQPPRVATDVDALASQTLGWPLPVAGMRDWLQGFVLAPGGQRQAVPRTPGATVRSNGWRIEYADWDHNGSGAAHPRRIDLERSGAGAADSAGPVTIRILIDSWQAR